MELTSTQAKYEQFVKDVMTEEKTPAQAYANMRGRKEPTINDAKNAARVFRRPEVQKTVKSWQERFKNDADIAYKRLWDLAEDPKTPASEKQKFYQSVISRAGLDAAQRVESKNETVFKGLNDKESYKELLEQAYKEEFGS